MTIFLTATFSSCYIDRYETILCPQLIDIEEKLFFIINRY